MNITHSHYNDDTTMKRSRQEERPLIKHTKKKLPTSALESRVITTVHNFKPQIPPFSAQNLLLSVIDYRSEDRKNVGELRGDHGATT